jgi:hypothetical protein
MAILTPLLHHQAAAPGRCRHRRDPRAFLCALLVTAAGWIAGTSASFAQEALPSEYEVKAAFLVNFPKYVEWPAQTFAGPDSPVVIAVLGETKVAGEIQMVIVGRTVNGRKIVLKRVASGQDPGVCQVLFISAAEQQHSPGLLASLKSTGILTVGESGDFLDGGGIINLAHRDQKIALEVNLAAARDAGIKISAKLLGVASVVKGKSN